MIGKIANDGEYEWEVEEGSWDYGRGFYMYVHTNTGHTIETPSGIKRLEISAGGSSDFSIEEARALHQALGEAIAHAESKEGYER